MSAAEDTDASGAQAKEIFEHFCAPCYAEGKWHPGTMRLRIRWGDERGVLLRRDDLTSEYVKLVVRGGMGLMPGFRPSEIDDAALEAMTSYLADRERG